MKNYGVIAIGYNRKDSLERLLNTIGRADYKDENVLLIISIDSNESPDVIELAHKFEWRFGQKVVKNYPERLGLRKHILTCGSYIDEYHLDAAAIFEDDIIASPAFFNYMQQAVEFYEQNERVAGISLYTHLWNTNVGMPFQPAYSGYDNYFFKSAQSWGQIWLKKQWNDFVQWYNTYNDDIDKMQNLPDFVKSWPESSWLKYHIAYCVKQNKYFVYPYEALASCYSDKGQHTLNRSNLYQVPFVTNTNKKYRFSELTEEAVYYDAFFEREFAIENALGLKNKKVCISLYADRTYEGYDYMVSTQRLDYHIVDKFALELRPHEQNVIDMISGEAVFLYDLNKSEKNMNKIQGRELAYYYRLPKNINLHIREIIRIIKQFFSK